MPPDTKTTLISRTVGDDRVQLMQSMGDIATYSGAVRAYVLDLCKIADDIRLLASGPRTGLAEIQLPAVVTTDLRLNEPRYASLPGIMKARKKELKEIPIDSLGVDVKPKLKVLKLTPPPQRQAGRKVGSVQELVQVLHNEAKVI